MTVPAWARGPLPFVAGFAGALVLQFVLQKPIGHFYSKLLTDIGINIVLAVSLNIVNGFTGQFSIGHAGFMAAGAYTAAIITYYGSFKLWGNAAITGGFLGAGHWLFIGACLAGGLVAGLLGFIVGLPSLRLRGDYLAIVTLGFGEILRVMIQQTGDVLFLPGDIAGVPWTALITAVGGTLGFNGLPFYTDLFTVYAAVTVVLVVAFRLKYSTHGRAFLAIRENEIAASAMGIHVTRYKVAAFVIAAFFAGTAGGLFAHEVGVMLNPRELGFMKSIDLVIMVVLGGMGSVTGSALAAIVLTILPELLRTFADYRMVLYALALILMMILRPQGILGIHEPWELWWRRDKGAAP